VSTTRANKFANRGLSAYNFKSLEFSFTLGAVKLNVFVVLYVKKPKEL